MTFYRNKIDICQKTFMSFQRSSPPYTAGAERNHNTHRGEQSSCTNVRLWQRKSCCYHYVETEQLRVSEQPAILFPRVI